ncbi:MAG: RagB/SusD family nutrient uptake outer membrane protein [Bacteroidales bacterium]|nr:RagB/SusD family nutrient uptake outer membrane protein [Bacteroidales bacterium]
MKRKYIILSVIFPAIIFLNSCESLLDETNPNQTTVQDYWVNETSAIKGTNAIYAALQRKGTYRRWLYFAYDVRSDVLYSRSPWADLSNFSKFTFSDYNFEVNYDLFQDQYRGLFRANQVLHYVPGIDMDPDLKKRLIGEASFLRALFHYNLVNLYGNVPVADHLPTDPSQGFEQRTIDDVWGLIISDLKTAQESLLLSYSPEEVGRATWGAATGLLAKSYMQRHDYDNAIIELEKIIIDNEGLYELVSDYASLFRHTSENSTESVFEIQFSNEFENGPDQDGTATSSLGCNRSIFFAPTGVGWSDAEVNRWIVDKFLEERDASGDIDPRMDVTLIWNKPDSLDPVNLVYGVPYLTRFPEGHSKHDSQWMRKYQNDYWRDTENWDSPINFIVIRYADLLLLYAEALNETNRTEEAYDYIDMIRQRVGLETLTSTKPDLSQQEMRDQIEHERLLELAGESVRFLDLARWGKLSSDLSDRDPEFEYFVEGKSELLPIPTQEIDLNDVEQNNGW